MSNCDEITPTFTWLIEGYSHGIAKSFKPREIRSPLFATEHSGGATWYLAIKEVSDNSEDGIRCSLGRYSEDQGPDVVQLQWNLDVSQKLNSFKENDFFLLDKFEKGISRTACMLSKMHTKCFSLHNISLLCSTHGLLPSETLHFRNRKGQTKIQNFTWSPKDFSSSKLFYGPNGLQYEVFLLDSHDRISIRIRRSDKKNFECYLMYSFSVNYKGVGLLSSTPIVREEIGWSKSFDIDDTLEISNTFGKHGPFFESCEISGYFVTSVIDMNGRSVSNEKQEKIDGVITALNLDSTDILKGNLLQMFENKRYTDVKLQIGNEIFPTHKCLLSCRSPIFSTMFNQDMIENQTGVVDIPDMDGSTLNLLLKYMYTSVLDELHYEMALKLLLAAEKYQVLSLKEKCSSYLMSHISDENVCEILVAADMVSHVTLKSSAMNYVKEHAHSVLLSDSWNKLVTRNSNLVAETLSMISKEFGKNMKPK